ncbi:polysaccharide biosynthesis protein [Oricola sp.]|uniref:polysaccharide biosynthesis protein n=1 Tax=Oricola sp. TaxID=1979950 RepID=UPI003BA94C22
MAFKLRLGFDYALNIGQIGCIVTAPLVAIPVFMRVGLYRAVIRYLPDRILWTIVRAMTIAALLWTVVAFFTASYGFVGTPRTVPMLYWLTGVVLISLSRFALKWMLYAGEGVTDARRTLIYGAGEAGIKLAVALGSNGYTRVFGFVDDNPQYHGKDVAGHRVYPRAMLPSLIANYGIHEVILSMPSAPGSAKLEIGSFLAKLPVAVRVLPSISDIAAGRYNVDSLREFSIGELIGRSTVPPNVSLIEEAVRGKRIVITGAGGTIGHELTRLLAAHAPSELYLVENNEFALYKVHKALRSQGLQTPIFPVLGSIADELAMRRLFDRAPIDLVFHAAAYKHVDIVEENVAEGIRNNLLGTNVIASLAFKAGVQKFVLISTDKAVNPKSVMGATKRLSELVVRKYANLAVASGTGQSFLAVRFGNVIGSSGSVVPLFKQQIEDGGPVTVTDRNMQRYFMAISEAVELIVQSAALSKGGETFLLDMGEPVSIYELAQNMIRLAGRTVRSDETPDGDIEIRLVGRRPGEKLHEQLFYDVASALPTEHPKIMKARRHADSPREIDAIVDTIGRAVETASEEELRDLLFKLMDDYNRALFGGSDHAGVSDNVTPLPIRKEGQAYPATRSS